MKTLETERLILRDWQEDDAADCFELWSNPDIMNAGWKVSEGIEESISSIGIWIKCQESWAIMLKENKRVIGAIFLCDIGRHAGYQELEYAIAAHHQNKGYATEAVKSVLKYAFTEMGLLVVAANCYSNNKKSMRVIEKCGFTYEGTLRRYSRNLSDSVRYSLLKEEWEQLYGIECLNT